MQTNKDEQMVYLKDLLFCALYRWKRILTWSVTLAVLLGSIQGFSAYRNTKNAVAHNTPAWQEMEQKRYEAEKTSLESKLNTLQSNIQQHSTYLQESVLMQLNPHAFYEMTLSIYIDTGYQILPGMEYQNPDLTQTIISSYVSILTGENTIQAVASEMNIKASSLSELIFTSTADGSNTLQLRAKYTDETGAEKLLSLFVKQLKQIQTNISQVVQTHDVRILQQYVHESSDTSLIDVQTQNQQRLIDLYDSINNIQAQLEELVPPQPQPLNIRSVIKSIISFAVIGGVLGIFVVVFAAWISHICSSKVYSARTLFNRTNLKVLGCVRTSKKLDPITKKLRVLEGRNTADPLHQIQLIAANIRNLCVNNKHLLIINSCDTSSIADMLGQSMSDMLLTKCGSLLTDISAVEALGKCDYVLLIEGCGISRYTDIQQTLSVIDDNGKKLLGCVLLDG